jgi:hypothetical protein
MWIPECRVADLVVKSTFQDKRIPTRRKAARALAIRSVIHIRLPLSTAWRLSIARPERC